MQKISHTLLICLILVLAFPQVASAHPADMYFHTHTVLLSPDGIQVTWELIPGPMIAQAIWYSADQNDDQSISDLEALEWAKTIIHTYSVELAGESLPLTLAGIEWPDDIQRLFKGDESIQVHLQAAWPDEIGPDHHLALHNRYNSKNSISWYEVLGEDGITFDTPHQNRGTLELDFGLSAGNQPSKSLTNWESGTPSIPWVVESVGLGGLAEEAAAESNSPPGANSSPVSILEGLIQKDEGSLTFIFSAMVLAALLGALHALSPGHGKTIVAAYLVGSQGKLYHAVVLGTIVTFTHTGSVFILGIITLTASRYFLAADVFPILELISGLLILFLGVGLLYPRLRFWLREYLSQRRYETEQRIISKDQETGERRLVINQPIEEIGPPHSHNPFQLGSIPRGPVEGNPLASIRWRSLIPLAISGGLVPCPDAIAILLIAATINRIGFGLSLIVAFSLGLAVVLVAIGILIVQGKRLFERLQWFNKAAYIMPIISAMIVLGAGIVLSVSAVRNIGLFSGQIGDPGSAEAVPFFNMESASVLYTALDGDNQSQLYVIPAVGGDSQPVTTDANIWAFAIAPDHSSVIYATDFGENGSQLWQWFPKTREQVVALECPNAYCSDMAWSPDGRGILYSRLDFDLEINPANVQSIWWLDLTTRETTPLFQDPLTPGFSPRWSPDGKQLSYVSINPLEINIYQMETGESQSIATQLGYSGVWSPDGENLLLIDMERQEGFFLYKLYSYNLANQWLTRLSVDLSIDDAFPAWSPDGDWIALVRREWDQESPGNGSQVWIMRSDGTEPRQLTNAEEVYFGQPAWSPDGQYLLFDYRSVSSEGVVSGIKILKVDTGKEVELVSPGNRPAWLQ
jgi:ABC-type nickel/cobalt efflux system permease component RcnA/Tol biopolymer transport system component